MMPKKLSCSTVTPVYSGALYLEMLIRELDDLRNKWLNENAPINLTEAIFVIDDAIDDSSLVLEGLAQKNTWIKILYLSQNFGQHPATQAGILHSAGDWIVTLDEDLQHPPNQIEALLREVGNNNCDIVYAHPQGAVHENMLRDLGSRFYKFLMSKLTGNKNIPFFNSFRLIRGSLARAASSVCSHDTYFDIALSWFSQRVGCVEMILKDNRIIKGAGSGYTFRKLLSHARRMVLSSDIKVLRTGALIGFISIMISVIYGSYILYSRIVLGTIPSVQGWSSLMIAILFFGGIVTLLIGILIEYFSIIILHIQGKPVSFVIDRKKDSLLSQYFIERDKT